MSASAPRAVGDVREHGSAPSGTSSAAGRAAGRRRRSPARGRGRGRCPRARSGPSGSCPGRSTSVRERRVGVQHRVDELEEVDRDAVGDEDLCRARRRAPRRARRRCASAPRSSRASRRRARRPTGRSRGAAARACPSAGGRASCRRGRADARRSITNRSRNAASGSARPAASRRRGSEPCESPPSRAGSSGSMWPKWSSSGSTISVAPEAAAKRSLISTGTMSSQAAVGEQRGHAERQALDRGGDAASAAPPRKRSTTPSESRSSRAALQVQHARLRDDAGDRDARMLAGRRPRREMPARGVADRHDARAVHVERRPGGRSRRTRPRASPARRRRCRAGGTRCSTPPSRARRGPRRARPSASGRTRPSRTRRG